MSIEFQQQSKQLKASKLQMSNLDVQPRLCKTKKASEKQKNKKAKSLGKDAQSIN